MTAAASRFPCARRRPCCSTWQSKGGMHPRSKLAVFLWPDNDPPDARTTLRNAILLLRSLLADASPAPHTHLLCAVSVSCSSWTPTWCSRPTKRPRRSPRSPLSSSKCANRVSPHAHLLRTLNGMLAQRSRWATTLSVQPGSREPRVQSVPGLQTVEREVACVLT
jgi:hypothetical protein